MSHDLFYPFIGAFGFILMLSIIACICNICWYKKYQREKTSHHDQGKFFSNININNTTKGLGGKGTHSIQLDEEEEDDNDDNYDHVPGINTTNVSTGYAAAVVHAVNLTKETLTLGDINYNGNDGANIFEQSHNLKQWQVIVQILIIIHQLVLVLLQWW